MIVKRGGKWFLMTKDGSKELGGPYDDRDDAVKRERQVQFFKHQKKSLLEDVLDCPAPNFPKPVLFDVSAFSRFAQKYEAEVRSDGDTTADYPPDFEPGDDEIRAVLRVLLEDGVVTEEELRDEYGYSRAELSVVSMATAVAEKPKTGKKRGNIQNIISKFGSWAGGKHSGCVARLRGKSGITNPPALCAWMKDRYTGTTKWRGKHKKSLAETVYDGDRP